MYYRFDFESPIGVIGLVANERALTRLLLPGESEQAVLEQTDVLKMAHAQLCEYFRGERRAFSVPLEPKGTEFQLRAWKALEEIPYGQTQTYAQIAEAIGNPKAYRAVGLANNRNPIPIFIPCHRVVGSNGSLTGYRGGLEMKRVLLAIERGE